MQIRKRDQKGRFQMVNIVEKPAKNEKKLNIKVQHVAFIKDINIENKFERNLLANVSLYTLQCLHTIEI